MYRYFVDESLFNEAPDVSEDMASSLSPMDPSAFRSALKYFSYLEMLSFPKERSTLSQFM